MVHFESSISIEKPVGEVFDFVTDFRNDPRWHSDVLEASLAAEGSIGAGTVFNVKFKPFMGNSLGTMTVSEFTPSSGAVLKGQVGKMAPTITYSFAPEGDGTRLTRAVDVAPPGMMRVMAPLMKPMMRKQNSQFLANLKRVLESP